MNKFGEGPEKADKIGFRQKESEIMTRQEVRKCVIDSCKYGHSMMKSPMFHGTNVLLNIKPVCCFPK